MNERMKEEKKISAGFQVKICDYKSNWRLSLHWMHSQGGFADSTGPRETSCHVSPSLAPALQRRTPTEKSVSHFLCAPFPANKWEASDERSTTCIWFDRKLCNTGEKKQSRAGEMNVTCLTSLIVLHWENSINTLLLHLSAWCLVVLQPNTIWEWAKGDKTPLFIYIYIFFINQHVGLRVWVFQFCLDISRCPCFQHQIRYLRHYNARTLSAFTCTSKSNFWQIFRHVP